MSRYIYELPKENGQVTHCSDLAKGLSIINREGLYHVYFTKQLPVADQIEPLGIYDTTDIKRSIKGLAMLVPTYEIKTELHESVVDYASAKASARLEDLSKEEIIDLADKMMNAIVNVRKDYLTPRFAIVYVSYEGDEVIVKKTYTLDSAVAWCAQIVSPDTPIELINYMGETYRYEVYQLNALGEIDPLSKPVYRTHEYAV